MDSRGSYELDKELILIKESSLDKRSGRESHIEVKGNKIFNNNMFINTFNQNKGAPRPYIEMMNSWLKSEKKSIKFFIISEVYDKEGNKLDGDLDQLWFVLKKKGIETIEVDNKNVKTYKVQYTLDNKFMSMFWKYNYWYRVSDGVLVKYEPAVLPPGRGGVKGYLLSEENLHE